jgi:hypothetical protein
MAEENTPKDAQQESAPAEANADDANSDNGSDATEQKTAKAKPAAKGDAKPAAKKPPAGDDAKAKPKKEKPPAPEDKPFPEFIQQEFLPSLESALKEKGLNDIKLEFAKRKLDALGPSQSDECWQVIGRWDQGKRQFNVAFLKEDIGGQKFFSFSDNGSSPSTLEVFMVDERRVTLDLMVFYVMQRLNAQKWLVRN